MLKNYALEIIRNFKLSFLTDTKNNGSNLNQGKIEHQVVTFHQVLKMMIQNFVNPRQTKLGGATWL